MGLQIIILLSVPFMFRKYIQREHDYHASTSVHIFALLGGLLSLKYTEFYRYFVIIIIVYHISDLML